MQVAVTYDEATGTLSLFLVNRSRSDPQPVRIDLRAFNDLQILQHRVLGDDDIRATNSAAAPRRVLTVTVLDDEIASPAADDIGPQSAGVTPS